MDRLQKLERGWLFYKLRQLTKAAAVLAAAVLIGGGTVYLVLQSTQALQEAVSRDETPVSAPAAQAAPQPRPETPAAPEAKPSEPIHLMPSYDFEREIEQRVSPVRAPQAARVAPPMQPSAPAAAPASAIALSRVDSLAALERAFERQPSYAKAVELAESHLAQGGSEEALKWALKANELNNEDERSWAVFATASSQLGRKEQAIEALKAYLTAKPSNRLTQLLARLEQP